MSGDEPTTDPHQRIAELERDLAAARAQADQWREVAEDRRVTLERFRQHPVVRVLFRLAEVVLPPVRRARQRIEPLRRLAGRGRRVAAAARSIPGKLGARSREQALRSALHRLPAPPADARTVSLVVLTHNGRENLERLLPALRATTGDVEVLVVDNGSDEPTRQFLAGQQGVTVLRNEQNLSFSTANNRAVDQANGDVVCFLNDDVEPLAAGWLERMLAELHDDVVAVGAQLVYPRRPLLASSVADLTVQHLGTRFGPGRDGVPHPANVGGGAPDPTLPPVDVPAATAAALLVDRAAFAAVGGFDDRYEYGAEDVDLCWRLRTGGGRIRVAPGAVLFHHEGATRHTQDAGERAARQARNWDRFAARFGPELARAVELDRLRAERDLTDEPYEVAITITRDLEEAGYGDWYTARELGRELEQLGWHVRYIEKYRDAWYDLPASVDLVISLLDTFDVRRVARPGLTTIAWVRNWGERWATHPWFDEHDVVLASSQALCDQLAARSRHQPVLMPLATNPTRWRSAVTDTDGDVVLPVNNWGADRGVEALVAAVPELHVHGKGWQDVPAIAANWRGHVAYDDLPAVYAGAGVVVDQAAHHTLDDGSVNARVFDALAAGTMVVSNQVTGVRELFGDLLPTWETPQELRAVLDELRDDPDGTRQRLEQLQATVLERHTYASRAVDLQDLLVERAQRPSLALLIGAPNRRVAPTWGDLHLAEALARELRAAGCRAAVFTADEWTDRAVRAADVAVHVKGRGRVERAEGQVHVVWNISHPDELTDEEAAEADLVLVASTRFADEVARRVDTPVATLLQATDHRRFRPVPTEDRYRHDVAFVGNSKHVFRPVVADALDADLDVAVYGANWEKFIPADRVRATHVPNDELPAVYASVRVLLNDHWDDMRRWGFVSNRAFDVLAVGGAVLVSDDLPDLHELFDGCVPTYATPDELAAVVGDLLDDADERARLAARGRDIVLAGHTFAHRAEQLLELLSPLLERRGVVVPPAH